MKFCKMLNMKKAIWIMIQVSLMYEEYYSVKYFFLPAEDVIMGDGSVDELV